MSVDIFLLAADDEHLVLAEWNYTGNINTMALAAFTRGELDMSRILNGASVRAMNAKPIGHLADNPRSVVRAAPLCWADAIHGLNGAEGAAVLHAMITTMRAEPDYYAEHNPINGWGDYESFLAMLEHMRNAVPEYPVTRWLVHA